MKTAGLCVPSELDNLNSIVEVEKRVKEMSAKTEIDIYSNPKMKEILHQIIYNKFHMVTEVIGDGHIVLFFPLPYFRLEAINKAFADSEKYADISLHWITLQQIADNEFNSKYLTAFDF